MFLLLLVLYLDFGGLLNDLVLIENYLLFLFVCIWVSALKFHLNQELSLISERILHSNIKWLECTRILTQNSIECRRWNNSSSYCNVILTLLGDFNEINFKLCCFQCFGHANNARGNPFDLVRRVKHLSDVRCHWGSCPQLDSDRPLYLRPISFNNRYSRSIVF